MHNYGRRSIDRCRTRRHTWRPNGPAELPNSRKITNQTTVAHDLQLRVARQGVCMSMYLWFISLSSNAFFPLDL